MRIHEIIAEAPIQTITLRKDWRKNDMGMKPDRFTPLGKIGSITVGITSEYPFSTDIGLLWKDGTLCGGVEMERYRNSQGEHKLWATGAVFADHRMRGKGLMPKVYAFLVNHGYDLRSDDSQSPGGQYIWAELAKDPTVTVYAAKWDYDNNTWEYTAVDGIKQLRGNFYLYQDEMDEELKYVENEMESLRAIRDKVNDEFNDAVDSTPVRDRPSPKMKKLDAEYDVISHKICDLELEYRELNAIQRLESKHNMFLLAVPATLAMPDPKVET